MAISYSIARISSEDFHKNEDAYFIGSVVRRKDARIASENGASLVFNKHDGFYYGYYINGAPDFIAEHMNRIISPIETGKQ